MAITSVALPAIPACPAGPPALTLPARTWNPTPARKSVIVLFVSVALVMLPAVVGVPEAMSDTAEPGVATSPVSESALPEMFALVIVPAKFRMSMPSASVWLITLLVIVTTPVRFGVVVRLSSNVMLFSSLASPAPVIVPSVKLNPFT